MPETVWTVLDKCKHWQRRGSVHKLNMGVIFCLAIDLCSGHTIQGSLVNSSQKSTHIAAVQGGEWGCAAAGTCWSIRCGGRAPVLFLVPVNGSYLFPSSSE